MPFAISRFYPAGVALAAAAINLRVAVQQLLSIAAARNSDSIVVPGDGREVESRQDQIVAAARLTQGKDHSSPLIMPKSEPLQCTTSSCESGNTKFSWKA